MSPGARTGTRMGEDIWHCAEWGWPKRNLTSLLASRRMFRGNCCFQNLLFPENGIVEPQGIDPGLKPAVERLGEEQACRLGAGWNISQPQNFLCYKCFFTPWQFVLVFPEEGVDYTMIPYQLSNYVIANVKSRKKFQPGDGDKFPDGVSHCCVLGLP